MVKKKLCGLTFSLYSYGKIIEAASFSEILRLSFTRIPGVNIWARNFREYYT